MFDLIFEKFEKDLLKDYPDYSFYITDEMEEEDFAINTVICEIGAINVVNSKNYSAQLSFYITKPKIQDDLGNFIVQTLDIMRKIQNLDRNKTFHSKKLTMEYGELRSKEVRETFRVCRITGEFEITNPVENIMESKEEYKPLTRLFINKKEVKE